MDSEEWRPAAICISNHSLERDKVMELMKWLSYQHGFGTYFHFIEGYFNRETYRQSQEMLSTLIENQKGRDNTLYIDTMISPSYTSAIAQIIQSPSISGMENNMVVFEYDMRYPKELDRILDNVNLVRDGNFDTCIFASSDRLFYHKNGMHVWITDPDDLNTNFMILLGYIILAHPDWHKSSIKIFIITSKMEDGNEKEDIKQRISSGRLPISIKNIEMVIMPDEKEIHDMVTAHSHSAALTIVGIPDDVINNKSADFFTAYEDMGDILFVNTTQAKDIK